MDGSEHNTASRLAIGDVSITFIFRLTLCMLVGQALFGTSMAMMNKIKPESAALLKEIKANLRKNNDDYVESSSVGQTTETSAQTTPAVGVNTTDYQENGTIAMPENRRREPDQNGTAQTRPGPTGKTLPTAGVLLFRSFTKKTPAKAPKKYSRPDKLMQFIKRNKGKLERFRPLPTRHRAKFPDLAEVVRKATRAGAHWGAPRGSPVEEQIPNDAQLDMAPAKGSRVHLMRLNGRMCQRSVLLPEGPKYDRKGKVYLPVFTGRSFAATRGPDLLLPRCCNCCKKSVLGCE